MQVEIINPQGKVAYRRPHDHPDVMEAMNTPGYSVRGAEPKGEPQVRSSAVLATVEQRFFTTTLAHQRIVVPLVWKWNGHLSGPRCVTAYRCERYKAQKEVWCDRIGFYPLVEYRGGGTSYFLDGDKREYKSEKALITAINKRHNEKSSHDGL